MTEAQQLLMRALELEAGAQRALLAGADASAQFAAVALLYRQSWEAAPPRAFGRLVGMLKATVLGGGDLDAAAAYAREQLGEPDSPPAWYVVSIAALITGDDATARAGAAAMRAAGSPEFGRAAAAIAALADRDASAYARAVGAIVADFEARDQHLTGVAIADTAAMLQALAARRAIAATIASPLLP